MGVVKSHINATHIPQQIGVTTQCELLVSGGDWRPHLFNESGLRSDLEG